MNRKLAGSLAVVVIAFAAVWFFALRRHGEDTKPATADHGRSAAIPANATAKSDAPPPKGMAPRWSFDRDPEGPFRLEGQVVGPDGKGVGGAEVWLGSSPARSVKSEEDGGFAFDKLVGRSYTLTASVGELVGGPVNYKLGEASDPVVIHLGEGAALVVTVTGDDAKPIASADVKLTAMGDRTVKTGDDGRASVKPVHPGWVSVEVSASGYAPSTGFTTVGSAGATGQLAVKLHKGVAVSGRVIDETGKPIAKARVATTGPWGAVSDDAATTDDKGQFTIPAVAAGSHALDASDGEHAPATSTPVTVADRPVTGVEITMKGGGTLAGVVVGIDGKPARFATVRVAGTGQRMWMVAARQATSDASGKFELRGLARTKLQARAESDAAASKVLDVNLHDTAARRDLKLVLDVSGTIAGTVVDDKGQPVAEIQVNAYPDFMAGAQDATALAGMSSATTDGGGGFSIHGLPDGAYRLWAAHATGGWRDWGERGTQAKVGDTAVRITLSAPGSLTGKIALEGSGAPPALASISVGYQPATPASNGDFAIKDLTPGTYDIRFVGPEFAEHIEHGITIASGKPTDLGTITVSRGRKLVGKVVDGSGAPVAGAKVRVGAMLFSVAGAEEQMDNVAEMSGLKTAYSDQDGDFTLIGVPRKATNIAADHPDRGRSNAVQVPEGSDDPPPITLSLRGFGSIAGHVTMQGQPQSGITLTDSPKDGGAQATIVQTDSDGNFSLAKVSEGTHVLNAMQTSGFGMSIKSTSTTVQVVAGKQTTVAIDIPVGTITLTVQIKALPNNKVDAAQVFLFAGAITAANAAQLTDGFLHGSVKGMKFWFGDGKPAPAFDELTAGNYSICTVPITGNFSDPTFQQRLGENMQLLKVYCMQVVIAASPNAQSVAQSVPAMVPLPDPGGGSGSQAHG